MCIYVKSSNWGRFSFVGPAAYMIWGTSLREKKKTENQVQTENIELEEVNSGDQP